MLAPGDGRLTSQRVTNLKTILLNVSKPLAIVLWIIYMGKDCVGKVQDVIVPNVIKCLSEAIFQ